MGLAFKQNLFRMDLPMYLSSINKSEAGARVATDTRERAACSTTLQTCAVEIGLRPNFDAPITEITCSGFIRLPDLGGVRRASVTLLLAGGVTDSRSCDRFGTASTYLNFIVRAGVLDSTFNFRLECATVT